MNGHPTGLREQPLDIAQREFTPSLRGYDRDEVREYLRYVAAQQHWMGQRLAHAEARLQWLANEHRRLAAVAQLPTWTPATR